MTESTTGGAPALAEPDFSDASRLARVFFSPSETFAAIARRPSTFLALALLVILSAVVIWVGFGKVDPADFMRAAEARGQKMPEGADPGAMVNISRWVGVAWAFIGTPILYGVMSLLCLTILRLFGSDIDFRRVFSTVLHGMLPFAVALIVALAVVLVRDRVGLQELQGGNVLASSLGAFVDEDAGKVTKALLGSVDLFSIWCIALLSVGFTIVARVKRGQAIATVGVVWGIGVLIKVALSTLQP